MQDLRVLDTLVRVDQSGVLRRELQAREMGSRPGVWQAKHHRVIDDAVFLAGFSGPDGVVQMVSEAVLNPVFAPYLGRREYPPTHPFHLGVHPGAAFEVLQQHEWLASESYRHWPRRGHDTTTIEIVRLGDHNDIEHLGVKQVRPDRHDPMAALDWTD